jgi:adenylate cyclase
MGLKWKQQLRQVSIPILAVTGCVLLLRTTGIFQSLELAAFDQFMRLRSPEIIDDRIVIVGINESDLQTVKQWPISDRQLAELLNKIKQQNPRAIGLDIYRDLSVDPGNAELVALMQSTPNLIGIRKVVSGNNENPVAPPQVLAELDQVGANDFPLDVDGKIRRAFLYLNPEKEEAVFSLGFRLAWLFLAADGIEPQMYNEVKVQLGQALFEPFGSHDGGYVWSADRGYQMILNYRGGARHFETVSLMDVLEDRVADDLFRDRVVLIGSTAKSLKDFFLTPYSSTWVKTPEVMSGVEIHANITSAIISAARDGRVLIQTWNEPTEWLWILLWSSIGTIFICRWRDRDGLAKLSIRITTLRLAEATILLVSIGYFLFNQGWWIPVIPPLFALIGAAIFRIGSTLIDNLKLSYQKIEDYAATLEIKVEHRTLELQHKNTELEQTLQQLKAAQKQMIAQEKLASLGSLTAGIAHEIRNPLNFVNNFSAISLELAEEIKVELEAEEAEKDLEYVDEIFGDLKNCVTQINKHGQRIESIVNNMLMHAREDRQPAELIDLNHLLADSVQLVYKNVQLSHPEFYATIETHYDPNIEKIEAIFQDISRAFLNILDNACYALRMKQKEADSSYQPLLQVTSCDRGEVVEVIIHDNGVGIAPDIINKLFNPFFTTKPPGEGTGLGLSLTHDTIVALHNGRVTVASEMGEYAEFTIVLPKKLQLPSVPIE